MKRGSFKIGNLTSESINAVIVNFPVVDIPNRKYTLNDSSVGIDRSILFDDNSYENRKISLTIGFKEGKTDVNERIAKLMASIDKGEYVDLVLYSDYKYTYQVIRSAEVSVTRPAANSEYREISLEFSAAPYKYLSDVEKSTIGINNVTLTNPTLFKAKPRIKIVGSGKIILTVNGEQFIFNDVDESIELDSSLQSVYKMSDGKAINQNNKMVIGPFPELKPGTNNIKVSSGTAAIEPRWRTL